MRLNPDSAIYQQCYLGHLLIFLNLNFPIFTVKKVMTAATRGFSRKVKLQLSDNK